MEPAPRVVDGHAIAQGLRSRDSVLIELLVDRYKDRLFRYLLWLSGDRQQAEDLFQETWLRVLDRGHQYDPEQSFRAWLLAIGRHLFLDGARRRRVETSIASGRGDEEADGATLEDGQPSAFDRLAAREREERIEERFRRLSPLVQEVLRLRLDQGLALEEIARVTGAPLPTVKARLYRGAAALVRSAEEKDE